MWRPRILANAAVRSGSTTSQMTYKRSLLVSMLLVSCRPPWRNYAQEQELKSRQGPTHIHFLCSVSMSCNPEIKRSASPRFNNTRGVTRRPWRCKNSTWAHFPLQTLSRAGNSSGLLRSACGFEPHPSKGALALISRSKPPATWRNTVSVILVIIGMLDTEQDFFADACGARSSARRPSGRG